MSSAPRVIGLHGMLGAPACFARLRALLEGELDLVALALRPSGSTFDEAVRSLAAALPRDGKSVLCGYSMGGRLALAMAAHAPASVQAVVAIGAHLGLSDPAQRQERLAWERDLATVAERHGIPGLVSAWERLPVLDTQGRVDPALLDQQRRIRLGWDVRTAQWALRVVGTGSMPLLEPRLAAVDVPIHLVTGALDTKLASIASGAAARLGAHHHTVEGVGHNVLLEAPWALAEILRKATRSTRTTDMLDRRAGAQHDP